MINWKKILQWVLVLFTTYLAFEIVKKMLGGSLGFEELVIGLLVANIGFSFHLHSKLSEHLGWHKASKS